MTGKSDTVTRWTDAYFNRTKQAIDKFGDCEVTYAIFLRRPVVSAPRLAIEWLEEMSQERGTEFEIDLRLREGRWVGAGEHADTNYFWSGFSGIRAVSHF